MLRDTYATISHHVLAAVQALEDAEPTEDEDREIREQLLDVQKTVLERWAKA